MLRLIVLFLLSFVSVEMVYQPPKAKVEPLYPSGIRISVPDSAGISLVAFHVNINEEFYSLDAGTIAKDIVKPRNGRWVYQDRTTELKPGDTVHYWVHVVYNGLGYNLLDQQHRVTEFYNLDGTVANTATPPQGGSCDTSSVTILYDSSGNPSSTTICSGSPLFEEEFGIDNINETTWTIVEQFSDSPDYLFVVSRNSPENLKARNGKLKIMPKFLEETHGAAFIRQGQLTLNKCTGRVETTDCKREARGSSILPPVSVGRIDTRRSFAFTYGRILIRAKLPRGDWIYPLITLEPLQRITDFERRSEAELDPALQLRVVSSSGNEKLKNKNGRDISNHVIWAGPIQRTKNQNRRMRDRDLSRISEDLWSKDFHDYELEWRPRQIVVRVDNIEYGSKELDFALDKPYYINIALSVGGVAEFPDMSVSDGYTKPWRNSAAKALFDFYNSASLWRRTWNDNDVPLEVDYVKVYAL